jgi:hypothetical protein
MSATRNVRATQTERRRFDLVGWFLRGRQIPPFLNGSHEEEQRLPNHEPEFPLIHLLSTRR